MQIFTGICAINSSSNLQIRYDFMIFYGIMGKIGFESPFFKFQKWKGRTQWD